MNIQKIDSKTIGNPFVLHPKITKKLKNIMNKSAHYYPTLHIKKTFTERQGWLDKKKKLLPLCFIDRFDRTGQKPEGIKNENS